MKGGPPMVMDLTSSDGWPVRAVFTPIVRVSRRDVLRTLDRAAPGHAWELDWGRVWGPVLLVAHCPRCHQGLIFIEYKRPRSGPRSVVRACAHVFPCDDGLVRSVIGS